ncbi:bifunctional NAD(P)H-hydrate repair enzyme [Marinobacter zhanjiangensis]|uniref:Bifunctional NAD(P)H-hydrate repair enzyme n=1 Tax=Marinobacter zhanjiangensis TaxID=578215 RepID=A0ABQ3B6J3_9GAMM|nr:bifunctional NAD(P)H-hydrate repair enzyme [Marinobacter zhanjiangensis]
MRALDRFLIDDCGVDGYGLMQKAARAAFRQVLRHWPSAEHVVVLCGAGNNGGDGYLVALNALRHGLKVTCVAVADPEKLSGDARKAWRDAGEAGVAMAHWADLGDSEKSGLADRGVVLVDAMLGTGARGRPRPPVDEVIAWVNGSGAAVLAVDVPSGLDASLGTVAGDAVQADVTATFIGNKLGLMTGRGPHYAGQVAYETLGAEQEIDGCDAEPVATLATWSSRKGSLPVPSLAAHKGDFGHVLVVAGDLGLGGAGLLAAEAAARSGAGLVTLATRPEHVPSALARCPSLMARGVEHGNELGSLLEKADVVVCGPGIGQGAWGQQMLQQVLAAGKPRLLDADALNLLSTQAPVVADDQVMTPHPGEAARLLDCSVADVEADRLAAVQALQQRYGGVVLLKGAGTLVAAPGQLPVLIGGANPGMATGGMGDVLSGIAGGFMAQAVKSDAMALPGGVINAATLHLAAANVASRRLGYRALLPQDVMDAMAPVLMSAESGQTGSGDD